MSASKVWLYVERERVLEQMARLQELKSRQVQNQRRIRELLLRTDPNCTDKEVRGMYDTCVYACTESGRTRGGWMNDGYRPYLPTTTHSWSCAISP